MGIESSFQTNPLKLSLRTHFLWLPSEPTPPSLGSPVAFSMPFLVSLSQVGVFVCLFCCSQYILACFSKKKCSNRDNGRANAMTRIYTTPDSTLKVFWKKYANIMTFHLQTWTKHSLCLVSLSCLSSFFPHQTVSTTRTETFICLVHRGIITSRTSPNVYRSGEEEIRRQVLILVLPLVDIWFWGSFSPCRTLVSSSIKWREWYCFSGLLWGSNKVRVYNGTVSISVKFPPNSLREGTWSSLIFGGWVPRGQRHLALGCS